MADFSYINNLEEHIYKENDEFVKFLKAVWNPSDKNIIITHHLPSYSCIDPKYRNSSLNQFFANDLDYLINELKPVAWIFGHSHSAVDIKIGETRCVSMPTGYPSEISCDWAPKVIEV
jgi:Icc-related predicted phosphoesterase